MPLILLILCSFFVDIFHQYLWNVLMWCSTLDGFSRYIVHGELWESRKILHAETEMRGVGGMSPPIQSAVPPTIIIA